MGTQKNRLIETVLLSTKTYVKTDGSVNIHKFTLKNFVSLKLGAGFPQAVEIMEDLENQFHAWKNHEI